MAAMGMISKAIDRLPSWVQMILLIVSLIVFTWGVAHYGWTFILKVIFSPDL